MAYFIALEGGEGVGKSTQIKLLANALREKGIEVVTTREPGGTDGAEVIRRLLLDGAADRWGMRAEALLFAAARSDHVERLIRPSIAAGKWVLCDRYVDSSRAYQGQAGKLSDREILSLHQFGSEGLLPDLTLLLTLNPETVAARIALRDGNLSDRIGGRNTDFHAQVAAAFQQFARDEPGRFAVIPADGNAEQVHHRIIEALQQRGMLPS